MAFWPSLMRSMSFKIQSHIDSAEFGVVTGGVINMVSRYDNRQFIRQTRYQYRQYSKRVTAWCKNYLLALDHSIAEKCSGFSAIIPTSDSDL